MRSLFFWEGRWKKNPPGAGRRADCYRVCCVCGLESQADGVGLDVAVEDTFYLNETAV